MQIVLFNMYINFRLFLSFHCSIEPNITFLIAFFFFDTKCQYILVCMWEYKSFELDNVVTDVCVIGALFC